MQEGKIQIIFNGNVCACVPGEPESRYKSFVPFIYNISCLYKDICIYFLSNNALWHDALHHSAAVPMLLYVDFRRLCLRAKKVVAAAIS